MQSGALLPGGFKTSHIDDDYQVVLLLDYLISLSDLYVFAVAFTSPGAFDIVKLWASSRAFS